jgi:uncharacterized protein (DUF427 family)
MAAKPRLNPSAEHPIAIEPSRSRVVVRVAEKVIADSRDALRLRESTYPPVLYVPRKDVDMTQLVRSSHITYCPFKGECSYYSIPAGGQRSVNAVWSYEDAFDAVAEIDGYLAFYPNRVDAIEEKPLD